MKKLIIAAALSSIAFGVSAQSVVVHGHSYHSNGATNNANYGVGYNMENNFGFGYYRNSQGRDSFYVSYAYPVTKWLDIQFALATGYTRFPVAPGVLADFKLPLTDTITLHVMAAPTLDNFIRGHDGEKRVGVMLHSALEFKF
jgi:hypothetical protein